MDQYLYYTICYQCVVRDVFPLYVPLLNEYSFLKTVVTAGPEQSKAGLRPLGLWGRFLLVARMCVYCEYCVLSGRGPCDELITRPEESY